MAPAMTAGLSVGRGEALLPLQTMKYLARFSTTPSFLRPSKSSFCCRRAERMRIADLTPIPGTRSSIS